jgi:hypothetical protein
MNSTKVDHSNLKKRLERLQESLLQVQDNPEYYIYKIVTNNGIQTIKSDLNKEEFFKSLQLKKKPKL